MPGLIVASSSPSAEALVRRGAQPLLRRPWERLFVAASPNGQVALGFAGERGGVAADRESGCLAAFDGELFDRAGRRSGSKAASELLEAYLRDGPGFEPPEGSFAAAVWDERARALVLVTDRYASRPLYFVPGQPTLAAGELKALVACGLAPRLEPQAWGELLAYEHTLPARSLLANVEALPPASTLTLTCGRESRRERWRYRLEPRDSGDEAELVEEFGRLLERAVAARLERDTVLSLSGGRDSRCLALVLKRAGFDGIAATYGAPSSEDLRIGAEVARRTQLSHRALPLERGYIARGAAETVWLSEGRVRCFHAHHLALRRLRGENAVRSLLIGLSGDDVVRAAHPPRAHPGEVAFAAAVHGARASCLTDLALEEILAPSFADQLRGRAAAGLASALAEDDGDREARFAQLLFRNTQSTALFDDHLAPRDPFADQALIEFCRTLPSHLRENGRLQRSFLRRDPALAAVPSPKDGVAPADTGAQERLLRLTTRTKRRARRSIEHHLGPRWRSHHRGLGSYWFDLRHPCGAELLAILLEERTLARGQLRREAVRKLIERTLRGRTSDTRLLGMLMNLELFQRQFIDGDRYDGNPGHHNLTPP